MKHTQQTFKNLKISNIQRPKAIIHFITFTKITKWKSYLQKETLKILKKSKMSAEKYNSTTHIYKRIDFPNPH